MYLVIAVFEFLDKEIVGRELQNKPLCSEVAAEINPPKRQFIGVNLVGHFHEL